MADKSESDTPAAAEASVEVRRDALKKMGRYAAYTAPALLALLASTRAQAAS